MIATGVDVGITLTSYPELNPVDLAGDTFVINFGGNVFGGVNISLYYSCLKGDPWSRPDARRKMSFFGVVDECYFYGDSKNTPGANRYLGVGITVGGGFSAEVIEYGRVRTTVTVGK